MNEYSNWRDDLEIAADETPERIGGLGYGDGMPERQNTIPLADRVSRLGFHIGDQVTTFDAAGVFTVDAIDGPGAGGPSRHIGIIGTKDAFGWAKGFITTDDRVTRLEAVQ